MYSLNWFDTFAETVPAEMTAAEVDGVATFAPPSVFPRLLELGCGTGRVTGPLAERGYEVTGIDVSVEALVTAARRAPGPRYLALDQRHVGRMRWGFDVAVALWHSFGFAGRAEDRETLAGLVRVLRPGGRLLLDLFHPDWLDRNRDAGRTDPRGATVDRWVRDGRCHHEIVYPDGSVDDIRFNVYHPDEMEAVAAGVGFEPGLAMVWWDRARKPSADVARYQLVLERPEAR